MTIEFSEREIQIIMFCISRVLYNLPPMSGKLCSNEDYYIESSKIYQKLGEIKNQNGNMD